VEPRRRQTVDGNDPVRDKGWFPEAEKGMHNVFYIIGVIVVVVVILKLLGLF